MFSPFARRALVRAPAARRNGADHSAPLNRTGALNMGKFAALFFIYFVAGFGLLLAPPVHSSVLAFSRSLVQVAATLIHLFGGHALANGSILLETVSGFSIEMKDGCNGMHVTILLWAAVLSFPASWSEKWKGLLLGTTAIQGVNIVRFISLYYLGQYSRTWFDFAHLYLWESLIVLDTMVVFWLWTHLVFRAKAIRPVHG